MGHNQETRLHYSRAPGLQPRLRFVWFLSVTDTGENTMTWTSCLTRCNVQFRR
jgi:hypothetical protein